MSARRGIKIGWGPQWAGKTPEAEPDLPGLAAPKAAAPKLKLTVPTQSELQGQADCHSYLVRLFYGNPDFYVRMVPGGIPVTAEGGRRKKGEKPTPAQLAIMKLTAAWKRAGMREGTPDYEIIHRGRAHLIEYKKEGATLCDMDADQEDQVLAAMDAGCKVGLAHATQEETEELLLAWGLPLRFRLPPRPPHSGRALRWPLEGDRLREEILRAKRERAVRNTTKLLKEGPMPPSQNE